MTARIRLPEIPEDEESPFGGDEWLSYSLWLSPDGGLILDSNVMGAKGHLSLTKFIPMQEIVSFKGSMQDLFDGFIAGIRSKLEAKYKSKKAA